VNDMKNILIVGMGEIGKPLFEIIEAVRKFDVYGIDNDCMKCSLNEPDVYDIPIYAMHICIPCKDMKSFIQIVNSYYTIFKPRMIIINSTVAPTTTQFIADVLQSDCLIVHSPQFGTHSSDESMKTQMKFYPHMIGPVTKEAGILCAIYFEEIGLHPIIYSSSLETEIIKIMETSYTGWMITFFNEFHRMAEYYSADFTEVVDGLIKLYEPNKHKPIWYPDVINGHCIMQNIDLTLQSYKAGFLELIKESNELRKEEVLNSKIKEDIEKIKKLRKESLPKGGFY